MCSCPVPPVDLGFVVLVLWLFTQLNPAVWLFGNGDLRDLVHAGGEPGLQPGDLSLDRDRRDGVQPRRHLLC